MFLYFFFVILVLGFVSWLGYEPKPSNIDETYANSSYLGDPSLDNTRDLLCCDPGAPYPPFC